MSGRRSLDHVTYALFSRRCTPLYDASSQSETASVTLIVRNVNGLHIRECSVTIAVPNTFGPPRGEAATITVLTCATR